MRRRKFGTSGDTHRNYFIAAGLANGDRDNNTLYDEGQRKRLLEDLEYRIYLASQVSNTSQEGHSQRLLHEVLCHRSEFSSDSNALALIYDTICNASTCNKSHALFQSLLLSYTALIVSISLQAKPLDHSLSFFTSEIVISIMNASKKYITSRLTISSNTQPKCISPLKSDIPLGIARKRKFITKPQLFSSALTETNNSNNNSSQCTQTSDTQEDLSISKDILMATFCSRVLFALNILQLTQNNVPNSANIDEGEEFFENGDSIQRSENPNEPSKFLRKQVNQIQAGILNSNLSIKWIDALCSSLSVVCELEMNSTNYDCIFESWLLSETLSECIMHFVPNSESQINSSSSTKNRLTYKDAASELLQLFDNYKVQYPFSLSRHSSSSSSTTSPIHQQSQQYFFDAMYLFLRYFLSVDSNEKDKFNFTETNSKYIWPMNIAIFPDLAENINNDNDSSNNSNSTTVNCSLSDVKMSLLKLLITATHPKTTVKSGKNRLLKTCDTLSWLLHLICDTHETISHTYRNSNDSESELMIEQEMLVSLLSLAVNISTSISDRLSVTYLCLTNDTVSGSNNQNIKNSKVKTKSPTTITLVEKLATCLFATAACFQSDLEATDSLHVGGELMPDNNTTNSIKGNSDSSVPVTSLVTAAHFSLLIHALLCNNNNKNNSNNNSTMTVNEVCVAVCRVLPRHNLWLLIRVLTAYVSLCCVTTSMSGLDDTVSRPFQIVSDLPPQEQDNLRLCLAALRDLQQLNTLIASEALTQEIHILSENNRENTSFITTNPHYSPTHTINDNNNSIINTNNNNNDGISTKGDDWIFSSFHNTNDHSTFKRQKTRTFASSEGIMTFEIQSNESISPENNLMADTVFVAKSNSKISDFNFDNNETNKSDDNDNDNNDNSTNDTNNNKYVLKDKNSLENVRNKQSILSIEPESAVLTNTWDMDHCGDGLNTDNYQKNESQYKDINKDSYQIDNIKTNGLNTSINNNMNIKNIFQESIVNNISNSMNNINSDTANSYKIIINNINNKTTLTNTSTINNHSIGLNLTQLLSRSIHNSFSSYNSSQKSNKNTDENSQLSGQIITTINSNIIIDQNASRLPSLKRARMSFSQTQEPISFQNNLNNIVNNKNINNSSNAANDSFFSDNNETLHLDNNNNDNDDSSIIIQTNINTNEKIETSFSRKRRKTYREALSTSSSQTISNSNNNNNIIKIKNFNNCNNNTSYDNSNNISHFNKNSNNGKNAINDEDRISNADIHNEKFATIVSNKNETSRPRLSFKGPTSSQNNNTNNYKNSNSTFNKRNNNSYNYSNNNKNNIQTNNHSSSENTSTSVDNSGGWRNKRKFAAVSK